MTGAPGAGLFPGPGNRAAFMEMLRELVGDYYDWHGSCVDAAGPPADVGDSGPGIGEVRSLIRELSGRLARESTPWPSPLYLAHMTPDTPIAVSLAYLCAMLYNPNNVTSEASPVTTRLEHEVGDDLCRLVGYHPDRGWAHLSSGGHAANYEAIWIARNLRSLPAAVADDPRTRDLVAGIPPARLVNLPVDGVLDLVDALTGRGVPARVGRLSGETRRRGTQGAGKLLLAANAHYAWDKCADLLGFDPGDVEVVGLDRDHRIDLPALRRRVCDLLERGRPIVAVVATLGSTGEGSVDDLRGVVRLRDWCERRYGASFYLHVDAAFGGYCRAVCLDGDGAMLPYEDVAAASSSARVKPEVYEAFRALPLADSVTVDPHKGGHVPYPAGGLVLRDRRAAAVIAGRSAYFAQEWDGRPAFGTHTLEGARPGAAAAAVWAAHRTIGLHAGGYGRLLGGCIATARRLHRRFTEADPPGARSQGLRLVSSYDPDLNILNLSVAQPGGRTGGDPVGRLLERLRAEVAAAPMTSLWVSGNTLARPEGAGGTERVLRLCVMKHLDPVVVDHVCRTLRLAAGDHPSAVADRNARV
ncbi:glutamate/tyrosine decarboxylase-like PLP-dependent enzyme [Streptosporangium album]|uniref:Glutamate/tyrosine decarboxylase-like PLP-dependent enzyme n=1 Tax=Streptosporangium album TaxID=47479 RepID=A0A7W7RQY4_9ACTN|nr:pyridoxal-dependent decarboxylase [Streptosporangium album]MBB4936574.1 glutamate/tyrosine decarboxylase-like PLP-dependent enzyme [Streptosporangium album]